MTLARLDDPYFGEDELLQVLPELVKQVPDLTYVMAGGGKELSRMKVKARELGIFDRVVFPGRIAEDEKADHLRLADVFAMPGSEPTWFDRYPVRFSFLEAMACGIPVVASAPEEEFLSPRGNTIPNINVDPTDPDSIVSGIIAGLDAGTGVVPDVVQEYSFESFSTQLHQIVDDTFQRAQHN